VDGKFVVDKCPFCKVPCGNEHCPYYEDSENKKEKTDNLEELKKTIEAIEEYIRKKL
jgi:DNA repair exonuclease SbcCD ATPase subunit